MLFNTNHFFLLVFVTRKNLHMKSIFQKKKFTKLIKIKKYISKIKKLDSLFVKEILLRYHLTLLIEKLFLQIKL